MNADERTCPACAETIKKAADVCKHCGHRFRAEAPEEPAKSGKTSGCIFVAVVIGLLLLVAKCAGSGVQDSSPTNDDEDSSTATDDGAYDRTTQHNVVIASRDGVRARLRDPDSAEFRNVGFYSGGESPAVCGEVNAKNAFGGYTGYERFIALGEQTAFLASDAAPAEFADAWNKLCVKADADEVQIP